MRRWFSRVLVHTCLRRCHADTRHDDRLDIHKALGWEAGEAPLGYTSGGCDDDAPCACVDCDD